MKTLKAIALALTAAAVAAPAFAGRDETQIAAQERALKRSLDQRGLTAAAGASGKRAPAGSRELVNLGHPTERVRR